MKAYIAVKYHEDYRNKSIVDKISSVLEKNGYETVCITRDINIEEQDIYTPYDLMRLHLKDLTFVI